MLMRLKMLGIKRGSCRYNDNMRVFIQVFADVAHLNLWVSFLVFLYPVAVS
jgi:cadmium resistance protein CadD (predicted permease)